MQMVLWTLLYALRDCRELNMSPGAVTPCKAACPSQAPMWNQSSSSRSGEVATVRALLCCPACHLSPVSQLGGTALRAGVLRLSPSRQPFSAFSLKVRDKVPRENFRVLHGPSASAIASAPSCEALCGAREASERRPPSSPLLSERCRARP